MLGNHICIILASEKQTKTSLTKLNITMRLTLSLTQQERPCLLPWNYQYPLSSFIYHCINAENTPFADWLHNVGYANGIKQYRFFTFAMFFSRPRSVNNQMCIPNGKAGLTISFFGDKAPELTLCGLFRKQGIEIADRRTKTLFEVENIQIEPPLRFANTMRFRCATPMCISKNNYGNGQQEYIAPDHPEFEKLFFDNLTSKYKAALEAGIIQSSPEVFNNPKMSFRFLGYHRNRTRLVTIKDFTPSRTQVRGFCFDFEVTAPTALLELGYYAGFGVKNSAAGFGFVKVMS